MKKMHLAILFLTLAGCALNPAGQNKIKNYEKVGIISVLEDQLPIRYLGAPKPSTKEVSATVTPWSINQTIVNQVRAELDKEKISSLDISLDPQKLKAGKNEALGLKNIYLGNRYQALQQYFLEEAQKQGAQYLFVLHPVLDEKFPQHKAGYGMLCRTQAGDLEGYFLLRAELWNVQTKEVEARITVTPQEVALQTGKSCAEALKMPPEKLAALYKNQFMELAKRSVSLALSGTGIRKTR